MRTTAERMLADGRGALSFFADTRPVAAEIAATYSIHAGRTVTGWPTLTLRRGEIVYRDGGQRRAAAPRTVAGSAALTGWATCIHAVNDYHSWRE